MDRGCGGMEGITEIAAAPGYGVSRDGLVWSKRKQGRGVGYEASWRRLRPAIGSSGYLEVALCIDGKPKTFRVHRLVLEAFKGAPPIGMEALHGNGDRTDARLENLRWGTRAENCVDAVRHGTIRSGASARGAKLSNSQRAEICASAEKQSALATKYGVSQATISKVMRQRLLPVTPAQVKSGDALQWIERAVGFTGEGQ